MTDQEQTRGVGYDEDDFLHVGALLLAYFRVLVQRWYFFIGFLVLGIAASCCIMYFNYTPTYQATAYYTVERTMDIYTDAEVAARIAKAIPVLTSTADFREELEKSVGLEDRKVQYSFSASSTTSANFFNATVTCLEADVTDALLRGFEEIYPSWVNKSIGKCILTLNDEQTCDGVPANKQNWLLWGLYGLLAGFILWFLYATIRIASVHKVHSAIDLGSAMDIQCLAELPEVNVKNNTNDIQKRLLLSSDRVSGAYQRGVLDLRTQVEELTKDVKHPVVLVTSTLPQEGKSLVTLNLALALSERDKKVLVIDGDLRSSGINRILHIDSKVQKGSSDFLTHKERDILMQWEEVTILPVGTSCDEALRGFDRDLFGSMIRKLKESVDIVLLDTPPAGYFGDALDYSEFADLLLYVVRGDYAEVRQVRKHSEPFAQSGHPCGYVLNRMQHGSFGYGYGYGRYGYGKYGYGKYGYGKYGKYGYGKYGYGYGDRETGTHKSRSRQKEKK